MAKNISEKSTGKYNGCLSLLGSRQDLYAKYIDELNKAYNADNYGRLSVLETKIKDDLKTPAPKKEVKQEPKKETKKQASNTPAVRDDLANSRKNSLDVIDKEMSSSAAKPTIQDYSRVSRDITDELLAKDLGAMSPFVYSDRNNHYYGEQDAKDEAGNQLYEMSYIRDNNGDIVNFSEKDLNDYVDNYMKAYPNANSKFKDTRIQTQRKQVPHIKTEAEKEYLNLKNQTSKEYKNLEKQYNKDLKQYENDLAAYNKKKLDNTLTETDIEPTKPNLQSFEDYEKESFKDTPQYFSYKQQLIDKYGKDDVPLNDIVYNVKQADLLKSKKELTEEGKQKKRDAIRAQVLKDIIDFSYNARFKGPTGQSANSTEFDKAYEEYTKGVAEGYGQAAKSRYGNSDEMSKTAAMKNIGLKEDTIKNYSDKEMEYVSKTYDKLADEIGTAKAVNFMNALGNGYLAKFAKYKMAYANDVNEFAAQLLKDQGMIDALQKAVKSVGDLAGVAADGMEGLVSSVVNWFK